MAAIYVKGSCPQGCGETLALDDDHRIVCSAADCPDRRGVDGLLADVETDHIVLISEKGFAISHPLREHGEDHQECALHQYLLAADRVPQSPGRYHVVPNGTTWSWRPTWTTNQQAKENR